MPSRNAIKHYASDHYYHIYNRGVEKRQIFMDERDYAVFLSYLKVALSPELEEETKEEALTDLEEARLRRLRLHDKIDLLAYCLMPNHFHLFIYQKNDPQAMAQMMRSVMSGYVRYFNRRYDRVGSLFQGRYKASLIDDDAYLQHITRYIHLNPAEWANSPHSSYQYYLGSVKAEWINTSTVLSLFNGSRDEYEEFTRDAAHYQATLEKTKAQLVI